MELSHSQKSNPLNLQHLRILRIFLWSMGAWSGETLDEKMPIIIRYLRVHVPIQTAIVLVGEYIFYLKYHKSLDFFFLGEVYITAFLTSLTLYRTILPNLKNYGILMKQFFFSFHLHHFKHKSDYFLKMYNTIHRISHYFTLMSTAMALVGMVLFNVTPLYNNVRTGAFGNNRDENSTIQFSVYYTFPGFDPRDYLLLITFVNFFLSYCCSTVVCFIDLYLILMVFQIIGHILILNNNMENMPRPKKQVFVREYKNTRILNFVVELFDDEENKNIHKEIAGFVEHHKLIVSFTDDVSNFFGGVLAFNYCYQLVSLCLLLLECSQGNIDAIMRYGPLTIIIFGQLIQISVIFEVVNTVSEKMKDSVYEIPWECMNMSNQRSVCFMLSRMQIPINVTAMGMTTIGVQTMAGIMKTTFSYFAFLRSMN